MICSLGVYFCTHPDIQRGLWKSRLHCSSKLSGFLILTWFLSRKHTKVVTHGKELNMETEDLDSTEDQPCFSPAMWRWESYLNFSISIFSYKNKGAAYLSFGTQLDGLEWLAYKWSSVNGRWNGFSSLTFQEAGPQWPYLYNEGNGTDTFGFLWELRGSISLVSGVPQRTQVGCYFLPHMHVASLYPKHNETVKTVTEWYWNRSEPTGVTIYVESLLSATLNVLQWSANS